MKTTRKNHWAHSRIARRNFMLSGLMFFIWSEKWHKMLREQESAWEHDPVWLLLCGHGKVR